MPFSFPRDIPVHFQTVHLNLCCGRFKILRLSTHFCVQKLSLIGWRLIDLSRLVLTY